MTDRKPPSALNRELTQPAKHSLQRESSRGARTDRLAMLHCPNCSQRLEDRGCRLRCNRCGYFMDCSDYY